MRLDTMQHHALALILNVFPDEPWAEQHHLRSGPRGPIQRIATKRRKTEIRVKNGAYPALFGAQAGVHKMPACLFCGRCTPHVMVRQEELKCPKQRATLYNSQ